MNETSSLHERIYASGLFDKNWYLQFNPDVADNPIFAENVLYHFLKYGVWEGRNPSAHFDLNLYFYANLTLYNPKRPLNPLIHYLTSGKDEHRTIFKATGSKGLNYTELDAVIRILRLVMNSSYFLPDWYLQENPDIVKEKRYAHIPLLHFLEHGWKEGRNPSPFFDMTCYVCEHAAHFSKTRENPLLHYLNNPKDSRCYSASGKRIPYEKILTACEELPLYQKYMDTEWYVTHHQDVGKHSFWSRYPVLHYLIYGRNLGYSPSPQGIPLSPVAHHCPQAKPLGPVKNHLLTRKPLDLMLVTSASSQDGVYRYRVQHLGEAFRKRGLTIAEESLHNPSPDFQTHLLRSGIILFNRPSESPVLYGMIRRHKKVYYDVDDLLIPSAKYLGGLFKSNNISVETLQKDYSIRFSIVNLFDHFIGSTQVICETLTNHVHKKVFLLKNIISEKAINKEKRKREHPKMFTLLYASGSHTHEYDASIIAADLLNFMIRHPDTTLTILGKSKLASLFTPFGSRITAVGTVSFSEMLQIIRLHDILLVPLDVNPFNNAKSNIKYIEAGAVGVPVLASECSEFKSAIAEGKNGFLFTSDSFLTKLEAIYFQRNNLFNIGNTAREDIIAHYSTASENSNMDALLEEWGC